jgi:hypothetical protein
MEMGGSSSRVSPDETAIVGKPEMANPLGDSGREMVPLSSSPNVMFGTAGGDTAMVGGLPTLMEGTLMMGTAGDVFRLDGVTIVGTSGPPTLMVGISGPPTLMVGTSCPPTWIDGMDCEHCWFGNPFVKGAGLGETGRPTVGFSGLCLTGTKPPTLTPAKRAASSAGPSSSTSEMPGIAGIALIRTGDCSPRRGARGFPGKAGPRSSDLLEARPAGGFGRERLGPKPARSTDLMELTVSLRSRREEIALLRNEGVREGGLDEEGRGALGAGEDIVGG